MPTTNLDLPLIEAGQSQKHVTHNEALQMLDAIVMLAVLSATITAPPGSPTTGACYIVPAGATGAWAGKARQVAVWDGGAWVFYAPAEGWLAWNASTGAQLVYSGGSWISAALFPSIGIGGAAPDSTNALAFYGTNALFNSGGSIDLTLNKAATGDDASFSFKRAWSVRALFGLLASDDFTVKVSPDGADFFEAIKARASDGRLSFPQGVLADGFTIRDPTDPTKAAQFLASGITTGTTRQYTLPNSAGTLALLAGAQTFTGAITFSGGFSVNGATIAFGTATTAQTVNIGTGANGSGVTKAVNIGTGGAAGSTTNVNIGPTAGTGLITLNEPVLIAGQATDPASPADGTLWHNSGTAQLKGRANGVTRVFGADVVPFLKPAAGGFVQTTMGSGSTTATLTGAADRMDLFPWTPRADLTTDQMAINCTTLIASALAKLLIYAADANGRPNTLLLETGTVDLSTTGAKPIAVSRTFYEGVTYWLGVRHSSTAILSAWQALATPDLPTASVVTTAAKVMRRTLAFATAAPASWSYAIADVTAGAGLVAPAIWLRST